MAAKKKVLIIGSAAVLAIGGAGLYAGALGVSSGGQIGAGQATISASCDSNGVTVTPGTSTWNAGLNKFVYSAVTVSGIADTCDGQSMTVLVATAGGAQVSTNATPLVIPTNVSTSESVTLDTPVDAGLADTATYNVLIRS